MADDNKTFTQAIILALIPTLAGVLSAYFANDASTKAANVEERLTITQLRLDENALIGIDGFHLPIGDDEMWRDYYTCRVNSLESHDRVKCSFQAKETAQQSTHPDVAKPANLY